MTFLQTAAIVVLVLLLLAGCALGLLMFHAECPPLHPAPPEGDGTLHGDIHDRY